MKHLLILLLFPFALNATTYYVKASGGTGAGTSDATAWSYSKFNGSSFANNDSVLFNRGDVFYGAMNVNSYVNYASYGTGANPKITGLLTLTNWTSSTSNIFYSSIAISNTANVVMVDGALTGMGRFPKSGYITYSTFYNNAITFSPALTFNAAGAEAVVRKIRQVTDRQGIDYVSHLDTIGLSASAFGVNQTNNQAYSLNNSGMGFFIQNSLSCLTQDKDWFYDPNTSRLYMYFASNNPASHVVNVTSTPTLIEMDNKTHVTFTNIDFEGANEQTFNTNGIDHISWYGCNFINTRSALTCGNGSNNVTVRRCGFTNLLDNAIFFVQNVNHITVDSCNMYNVGTIQGAGGSGDGHQQGMWIIGDTCTITNNTLRNIGYHGIVYSGNGNVMTGNTVDSFSLAKDDAGGIYTFQFSGVTNTTNLIANNTITNGIGLIAGAPSYQQVGFVSGIYIDQNGNHTNIRNNIVNNMPYGGMFIIDNSTDSITGNVVSNSTKQMYFAYYTTAMNNVYLNGNTFLNGTGTSQYGMYIENHVSNSPTWLTSDNNIYLKNTAFGYENQYSGGNGVTGYSISQFQTAFTKELHALGYLNNNRPALIVGKQNASVSTLNASGTVLSLTTLTTMTTAQRNAIVNPTKSFVIFNLDTNAVDYYNGTVWKEIGTTP